MHLGNKPDSHWIKNKKATGAPTSPPNNSATQPLQTGLQGLGEFLLRSLQLTSLVIFDVGFSEFVELIGRVAVEGLQQQNYHIIFPTPFSKALAILTVWGVADLYKLEEVRVIRTDENY